MLAANTAFLSPPLGDTTATRTLHNDVEVHAVDAGARVVLQAEIDVLHNAEAKVASVGKVALTQLVLLHLEATLQQLLRLLAAHRHVASDLLVTADAEGAHGVAGCIGRAETGSGVDEPV
eukprot:1219028-Pleurochrysis_carterae.AAC.4